MITRPQAIIYEIALTIVTISVIMAVVYEVFVIQWLEKFFEGIIEFSNVRLCLINFLFSS
ncbi:hypothetical protein AGMMS50233_05710 [Endomicrobiia bacterium]|nr:hypothetical protein AGMMS50233_05710 [Endomicrobiia bacterium]